MIKFNQIQYPTCPKCLVLINDLKIFSLDDFTSPYFHAKECPKCKEPFLMKTRTELTVEVVSAEDL